MSQRRSADAPLSARTSITDIAVATSPVHTATVLQDDDVTLRSPSFESSTHDSIDDIDLEDPLGRIYIRDGEFEPFSRTEIGFISVSCAGVVLVPVIYLLVNRLSL